MAAVRLATRPRTLALALLLGVAATVGGGAPMHASAQPGWQWYKADLHVHESAASPDAAQDLGVLSQTAKSQGLNAVFLTDHGAGSNVAIGGAVANHILFDDTLSYWKTAIYGTVTQRAGALSTSQARTGTQSMHLASTSSGYGESIAWYKRGPNLRSGDVILKFSVYPTRLDPGSGAYVSVAIGGDSTLRDASTTDCDSNPGKGGPPNGYTTQDGVISPGKSNVLVWQLGTPRTPSANPNARVITYPLNYTPNAWNDYTINVTQALNDIPAADRPMDIDAVGHIKMVAAGNGGTADAYFDNLHLDASAPVPSAEEFIHRNSIVHTYDTGSFKMFPGVESGASSHASRFNYDITDPSQYTYYASGTSVIAPTQQSGYPAQLDHPGFPGGVSQAGAISNKGYGADLMEAVPRGGDESMITAWDGILKQGVPLIGTWSSDAHRAETFKSSTAVYSPSLDFDPLMRSLYEGRAYMAGNTFPGRLVFSADPNAQEPYPARYPIYVSSGQTSANLTLSVTDGLSSGASIRWVQDGATLATDSATGASYQATKSIPLTTLPTYVRAEVRDSHNAILAMSEPIFFFGTPGLPADVSYHVAGVTTPDGKGYSKLFVKGITNTSWSTANQTVAFTLTNPAGSTTDSVVSTSTPPLDVNIDGSSVTPAASLADEQSATASSWFYDVATATLYLRDVQQTGVSHVAIKIGAGGADTQAPTVPAGLTATAQSESEIDLSWTASTDDVGVTGYTIYRDGNPTPVATVDGSTTSFQDSGLTPSTTYSYTVDAFDAAGNHSAQSSAASDTTFAPVGATTTFNPAADAYVDSTSTATQGTNYGTKPTLRVDASPDTLSYLRFNVTGLSGAVSSAVLRVYATSNHTVGYDVFSVPNNTWTETGITYNNKPAPAALKTGSSGRITGAPVYTEVDVSSLVSGNGPVSLALKTTSSTALAFASREVANPPQLVVTTAGGTDAQKPSKPTGLTATAVSTSEIDLAWNPSSDNVGVTGYTIYRDNNPVGTVDGSTTSFQDTGLSPATSYTYTVDAFDAAGNHSLPSDPKSATTFTATGGTTTFNPVADAYVVGTSPTTNFGTATSLRVDASPDTASYLRFNVTGLTGPVASATLRVYATSNQSPGYDVFGVADNTWTETGLNYGNRPALAAAKTGSSGKVTGAPVYTTVDVTPLVSGNGPVSLALTTTSSTALALASRESATKPELVVQTMP